MNKKLFIFFLTLTIAFTNQSRLQAQCIAAPVQPACSGTPLPNNQNVGAGQTYVYNGTGSIQSMDGGTVIFCSNYSFNGNFNSGSKFYVKSGVTLTLGGLNISGEIYNYGTINANGALNVQNSNSVLMNATTSSIINMNGNNLSAGVSPGIINYGAINNVGNLTLQNGGVMCMGNSSSIQISTFTNDVNNGVSAPSGSACMRVTGNSAQNQNITGSSNLRLCIASGASVSKPGSATVANNCTACTTPLPSGWKYFQAKYTAGISELEWATSTEQNIRNFDIERSADGKNFSAISHVVASNSVSGSAYRYADKDAAMSNAAEAYYRIRQNDLSGEKTYSNTQVIHLTDKAAGAMNAYPNPTTGTVLITGAANGATYQVYGAQMNIVSKGILQDGQLSLSNLPAGLYVLRITNTDQTAQVLKIVKQ